MGGRKYKRRKTRAVQFNERNRSGSVIPPEKRKAKNRAKRKAAKQARGANGG